MAMLRATLVRALRSRCAIPRATGVPATRAAPSAAMAALARPNAARAFSSKGVNGVNGLNGDHGDELDDWEDAHGDVSPFERLLQHSQRFRDEVGLDELPERVEDEILGERDDDYSHEDELAEEEEEPTRGEETKDADHDDLEAVLDEREVDHAEFVGQIRKPHGRHSHSHSHSHSHLQGESRDRSHSHPDRRHQREHTRASKRAARWGVEQRVRREIGGAEDVDFEHGLRDLDERRAREKMYVQLLAREYDRDRVCQNCGEPGHVARNCMLPMICSNCGDVGHRRAECPHHSFSIEQLTAVKRTVKQKAAKSGRKKSESQLKAEERRRVELQAIRERHERMKQAFDDEMDEYLDHYERAKKSREDKARKTTEEQE